MKPHLPQLNRNSWWVTLTAQAWFRHGLIAAGIAVFMLGGWLIGCSSKRSEAPDAEEISTSSELTATETNSAQSSDRSIPVLPTGARAALKVNEAATVTTELDWGTPLPSVAEALTQIERRQLPEDGLDRVFAIVEATGEPASDESRLRLTMRLSMENPGQAALVFRPTGAVLWESQVVADATHPAPSGKHLTVFLNDSEGRSFTIDGSANPVAVLDAPVREAPQRLRELWPDEAVWEVTFIYGACSCPVTARVRRIGERTVRVSDLPILFPDDPGLMQIVAGFMGW